MPDAKYHVPIAIACCAVALILLSTWKGFSGWMFWFTLIFADLFGIAPDVDRLHKLVFAHRNPIFHSVLLPGLTSAGFVLMFWILPACPAWSNPVMEFGAVFAIAYGSHLLADLSSPAKNADLRWPRFGGRAWLLANGVIAWVLAGWLLSCVA